MNTIICGSKKYQNRDFNGLVDTFPTIVRINMLLPGFGYGKRDPNFHIFNAHINEYYQNNITIDEWYSNYKEYGISIDYLRLFKNYLDTNTDTQFIAFNNNNTDAMNEVLISNQIPMFIEKQLRCGLAIVPECIKQNIKPYLIGFSLKKEDLLKNVYNRRDALSIDIHQPYDEVSLIRMLHDKGLIDASLCIIEDNAKLTLDVSILSPSIQSIDLLKQIYNKIHVSNCSSETKAYFENTMATKLIHVYDKTYLLQ